ncbi:MAG TPA: hypothetical protein VFP52_13755, partial [Myxococcales bacterium]|nr:hypothetical protein [Myxococcales bacterium]
MEEWFKAIQATPIPKVLIFAGVVFLFLSVTGGIAGKIQISSERQKLALAIGASLLALGIVVNFVPPSVFESAPMASGPHVDGTSVVPAATDAGLEPPAAE